MIDICKLKLAIEVAGSEIFTLTKYLEDKDMELLHGQRFRKMITTLQTLLSACQSIINISESGVLPKEKFDVPDGVHTPSQKQCKNRGYNELRNEMLLKIITENDMGIYLSGWNAYREAVLHKQAKVEVMSVGEMAYTIYRHEHSTAQEWAVKKLWKREYANKENQYYRLATDINKELANWTKEQLNPNNKELIKRAGGGR